MFRIILVSVMVLMVPVSSWAQSADRWLAEMNEVELQCQQMDMESQKTQMDCQMQALRAEQEDMKWDMEQMQRQQRRDMKVLNGETLSPFD
jgi:hypothetical protein